MADGPAAYWRLGEPSGLAAADETGTHPATYNGSPTLGLAGALTADTSTDDTAAGFDGGNDFVSVPDSADFDLPATGGLTVEAWVWKGTNTPSQSVALVFRGQDDSAAPNYDWIITQSTNGRCAFVVWDGAATYQSVALEADDVALATPGRWHHMVAVWDADAQEMRGYLNGELVRSLAATFSPAATANRFYLGRRSDLLTDSYFTGRMDEVAVYRRVLTAAEILEHYTVGQGSFEPFDYPTAVLADGPLAYWRLGEASGAFADELGYHSGTSAGAPTRAITGALTSNDDGACRFDGVNDRITVPDATAFDLEEFTLEAIVRDRQPGFILMQGNGGASNYNWGLFRESGGDENLCVYLREDATTVRSAKVPDPNDGEWHHLAGTFDGQVLTLYLDGVAVASTDLGAPTSPTTNAGALGMSVWVHAATYSYASGDLDEVAIYSRALDADEIAAHADWISA